MAISGYQWLFMANLLMAIGGYFINDYGSYYINGY